MLKYTSNFKIRSLFAQIYYCLRNSILFKYYFVYIIQYLNSVFYTVRKSGSYNNKSVTYNYLVFEHTIAGFKYVHMVVDNIIVVTKPLNPRAKECFAPAL